MSYLPKKAVVDGIKCRSIKHDGGNYTIFRGRVRTLAQRVKSAMYDDTSPGPQNIHTSTATAMKGP